MPSSLTCLRLSVAVLLLSASAGKLCSQAAPTATQRVHLSAFAGVTGIYTGLEGGRNLSVTAGAALEIGTFFRLHPSLEVRGTVAVDGGVVDSQRNILGGLKLAKDFKRLQLYGDVLYGREQTNYSNALPDPERQYLYLQSYANVLSFGAGVEVPFSEHLRLKVDAQAQRVASPVTASGHLLAYPLTLGVVYRFGSGRFAARQH